jgi:hypothetical protein
VGLTPVPDTLQYSEADQAKIITYCRDIVIHLRDLQADVT